MKDYMAPLLCDVSDWIMHWFVSAGKQVFVKRNLHSTAKSFLAVNFKSFSSRKISNKANILIYFAFQKNRLQSESRSGMETNFLNIKVQVHVLLLYFPQRVGK